MAAKSERLQHPMYQVVSRGGKDINGFCLDPNIPPEAMAEYLGYALHGGREIVAIKGKSTEVLASSEWASELQHDSDKRSFALGLANKVTSTFEEYDMVCIYDVNDSPTSS